MLRSMTRTKWLILIFIVSTLATISFSHFYWFKRNEHVALWLEGIALVFIFALDYVNRLDDSEEHERQHKETLSQLALLREQVEAAKKQADASSDSVQLLKNQAQEQQLRELWRVLPILDDILIQTRYWLNLLNENRWNGVNSATKILPVDSSTVLVQAARHSNDLWVNVRQTFGMLSNADFALSRFYSEDRVQYRQEHLIREAHASLRNAEPRLGEIVEAFADFEHTQRNLPHG
jgi:hypothetical protein